MRKMESDSRKRLVAGGQKSGRWRVMAGPKVVNEEEFWSFLRVFGGSLDGFPPGLKPAMFWLALCGG